MALVLREVVLREVVLREVVLRVRVLAMGLVVSKNVLGVLSMMMEALL